MAFVKKENEQAGGRYPLMQEMSIPTLASQLVLNPAFSSCPLVRSARNHMGISMLVLH